MPGSPVVWYEITPGILPANAVVRLDDGILKSLAFTVSIDAITLSFFCLPKATTVTSSSSLAAGSKVTSMNV
ncbi:hypothetical protein SDC9_99157 [bioreactor metagenome]|uniref:Uncharacterized protein n=1 Tax=bioreactor metagenome TaxID=1076179 RepID=A0A645AI54_9ZZZZ